MHQSAMNNGKIFFDTYVERLGAVTVVDIGAQDVNGSLRQVCSSNAKYVGVDLAQARGIDIVLDDPYKLQFQDSSVDVIVSSPCFEH
jgi:predicted SAM-dependent methyltransferase